MVAKYSPKNFCKLKLHDDKKLASNTLEKFFIDWNISVPKKIISITINESGYNYETEEIIRKYEKLNIINFNYEDDINGHYFE